MTVQCTSLYKWYSSVVIVHRITGWQRTLNLMISELNGTNDDKNSGNRERETENARTDEKLIQIELAMLLVY